MANKKHWRFWFCKEYLMAILAVTSLTVLALDEFGHLSAAQLHDIYVYDVVVGCIFIIEFFYELRRARNRGMYLKRNWYFLLAAIPLPYSFAMLLRGLRLIRVFKLLKFGSHVQFEKRVKGM